MLLITCPYCGPRDEIEFSWGGDTDVRRPDLACTDQEWGAYLFERRNTRGVNDERWLHAAGCRQWFRVRRSSITHEILETGLFGESAPGTADIGGVAP
jgi:heterotetrameric sarcosine oxidase delta subunit